MFKPILHTLSATFYFSLLFYLLFLPINVPGQSFDFINNPFGDKNKEITIKIQTDGKIAVEASSLVLKPSTTYRLKAEVDYPETQARSLYKAIAKKSETTSEYLEVDGELRGPLLKLGWGRQLSQLKWELNTIAAYMELSNPAEGLNTHRGRFKYFDKNSLASLEKEKFYLSTQIKIANGCGDTTTITLDKFGRHSPEVFTTADCENAAPSLNVIRPNIGKEFARRYYNTISDKSKFLQDAGTDKVEADYQKLAGTVHLVDSIAAVLKARGNIISPCESLFDTITNLNGTIQGGLLGENIFLSDEMRDWLLSTLWLNGGELKLNPLPFTDKKYLPLKEGYDVNKAQVFNEYIENSIESMVRAPQVSGVQPNYALMDSLLTLRGSGALRYSHDKYNDSLQTINSKLRLQHSTSLLTAHSLSFTLLPRKQSYTRLLEFDASERLRRVGSKPFSPAMAHKDMGYALVSNVAAGQEVTFTATSKATTDESSAMRGINEVAGLLGSIFTQGGTLGTGFARLLNVFSQQPKLNIPGREKSSSGEAPSEAYAKAMEAGLLNAEPSTYEISVSNFASLNAGILKIYFQERFNLLVLKQLNDSLISSTGLSLRDCAEITGFPHDMIIAELTSECSRAVDPSQCVDSTFFHYRETLIPQLINDYITSSLTSKIPEYRQKVAEALRNFQNINTSTAHWSALVRNFSSPSSRIIPPDTIGAKTNTTPLFKNKIHSLQSTSELKEHTLTLNLIEGKKDTLARTSHTYKTSPGHWVSASFGPGYTFNKDFERIEAKESDGAIVTDVDDNRLRITSGLHVHFAPMLNTNDAFLFSRRLSVRDKISRLSLYLGVSFPQPLQNPHLGLSIEPWPGVRVIGGHHWYRRNDYSVVNNQIVATDYEYIGAGFFVSLNFSPSIVTSLIGIFN